jgi:predicted CXXCH cytochrome family protein
VADRRLEEGSSHERRSKAAGLTLLIAVALLPTVVFAALWRSPRAPHVAVPTRHQDDSYVGSGACKSCHPGEHASWSKTFHRSMTRVASDASFEPTLPARLDLDERTYELRRTADGAFEVSGPDLHQMAAIVQAAGAQPDVPRASLTRALASVPRVTRELVMVTGSHHYQAFWVENGEGRELRQLPFVYLLDPTLTESERWLPRRDAFLQPADALPHFARWNGNCVQCHSVAGRPGESSEPDPTHGNPVSRFDTSAAELGIACEACHGPGAEHARHYESPLARYLDRKPAKLIVNPERLPAETGSAVCGQCHSYFVPKDENLWWQSGFSKNFQAGKTLEGSRLVLDYARDRPDDALLSRSMDSVFWPDGTIRVGGREYNGLIKSPCFERGHGEQKLACTSCHSMHQSAPEDQLAQGMEGNGACTQCHERFEQNLQAHTHHGPESSGSQCFNCHMPKTTYALLKSIRSHRVTSPEPQHFEGLAPSDAAPNACNLCHLDRSLEWSAEWMQKWWGGTPEQQAESAQAALPGSPIPNDGAPHPAPPSFATAAVPTSSVPASLQWLLAGNAAQRVLVADAFAWRPALEASGTAWARPALERLEHDPYAAVRFVARRSLRALTKTGAASGRPERGAASQGPATSAPLQSAEMLDALTAVRDDRPITISE